LKAVAGRHCGCRKKFRGQRRKDSRRKEKESEEKDFLKKRERFRYLSNAGGTGIEKKRWGGKNATATQGGDFLIKERTGTRYGVKRRCPEERGKN